MAERRAANTNWVGLRTVLPRVLQAVDSKGENQLDRWSFYWSLAAGKEIAAVSKVDQVNREQVLRVCVSAREWLPALESLRPRLITEINRLLGGEKGLKDIVFKLENSTPSRKQVASVSGSKRSKATTAGLTEKGRRPRGAR